MLLRVLCAVAVAAFISGIPAEASALAIGQSGAPDAETERIFADGMRDFAAKDYPQAEVAFRRILDRDPGLLRVRLELARTLYMQRKDEQADYHFRQAAAENPSAQVMQNIRRFREAIRARRSWQFNLDFGFAPDSNINAATDSRTVDIYGLPFELDPDGRARSGMGTFLGGDASIRLDRTGRVPIYIGAYGRWLRYDDHDFDDAYLGAEAGPEVVINGGRLRFTANGLVRYYGRKPLATSIGGKLGYEKFVGKGWTIGGTLQLRHNDYARRNDVDGWEASLRGTANRPWGRTSLGFVSAAIQRNWATDNVQAFWRGQLGVGIVKELGWGLRPQLEVQIARQWHDGPLAPFDIQRRDWFVESAVSIYKRDWNLRGFAPSLRLTATRNFSTLTLYDQKRLRGEVRLTKAF